MAETRIVLVLIGSFMFCLCAASYVHNFYQNVSMISEGQRTRYARKSNDLQYCGTRINTSNFSTEALVASDWCELGDKEPGYVYMLKEQVITTQVKSWGFSSRIPVCATTGSNFEIYLTPRSGWTTIGVKVFNRDWNDILHATFLQGSSPLVDNVKASLLIQVLDDSFQTYVDGTEYVNFPFITGVSNYSIYLQVHPAPADIHEVIYRASPRDKQ